MLLTRHFPWSKTDKKLTKEIVKTGGRPQVDIYTNATEPAEIVLKTAMTRCFEQDPSKRATAREIETYLKAKLEELDPGRLDAWTEELKSH